MWPRPQNSAARHFRSARSHLWPSHWHRPPPRSCPCPLSLILLPSQQSPSPLSLSLKCVCGSVPMPGGVPLCPSTCPTPALCLISHLPLCSQQRPLPGSSPQPCRRLALSRDPHAWTGSLCVCGTPLSSFGGRAAFGPCCLLSCSAPALGVWAQRALTSRRPSGREVTRGSEQGNEWAALARVLRLPSPPCGLVLGCRRKNSKGG